MSILLIQLLWKILSLMQQEKQFWNQSLKPKSKKLCKKWKKVRLLLPMILILQQLLPINKRCGPCIWVLKVNQCLCNLHRLILDFCWVKIWKVVSLLNRHYTITWWRKNLPLLLVFVTSWLTHKSKLNLSKIAINKLGQFLISRQLEDFMKCSKS